MVGLRSATTQNNALLHLFCLTLLSRGLHITLNWPLMPLEQIVVETEMCYFPHEFKLARENRDWNTEILKENNAAELENWIPPATWGGDNRKSATYSWDVGCFMKNLTPHQFVLKQQWGLFVWSLVWFGLVFSFIHCFFFLVMPLNSMPKQLTRINRASKQLTGTQSGCLGSKMAGIEKGC